MYPTASAGHLVRHTRLSDSAADCVRYELLVTIAPGPATIDLRNNVTIVIEGVGVDAGKGTDTTRGSERAGAPSGGDRHTLAALDDRQDLATRDIQGLQQFLFSRPFLRPEQSDRL